MTEDDLLIHELAEKTGVSSRTVRYYIVEGLLPEPSRQGKYNLFNQCYVERLKLIQRMKDAYLPLKEIRRILSSLGEEEIREILSQMEQGKDPLHIQPPATALPAPLANMGIRESAREYIRGVFESKPGTSEPRATLNRVINKYESTPQRLQIRYPGATESWQRVTLSDGVELHFRDNLTRDEMDILDLVILKAKRMLSGKTS